ncbi:SIMPL domain-containing protein [Rhodovulum sp. DZ06]|uniref:SIMPL domain-containing protein n=1 Tax=Rhodovulum sp. DZ06 TaxID=3425126 RepID=UPI003D356DEE
MTRTAPAPRLVSARAAACGAALLAALAPAAAQAESAYRFATLSLSAQGESQAAPDAAEITFRAEARADGAVDAMASAGDRMTAILAAVKGLGVPSEDIATTDLSLFPRTIRDKNGRERVEQVASTAIRVRTDAFDLLGRLVEAATAAGATHVGSPRFVVSQMAQVEDAARAAAVDRLMEKAEKMACAAGMRLTRLVELREGEDGMPAPAPRMAMRADGGAELGAPPLEAGVRIVRVSVSGTWEIAEGSGGYCDGKE